MGAGQGGHRPGNLARREISSMRNRSALVLAAALAGCSSSGPGGSASGGSVGSGGQGTGGAASGGSTGTGGQLATGGATGAGGVANTGGGTGTGGVAGQGGAVLTGGSGGSSTGTAGAGGVRGTGGAIATGGSGTAGASGGNGSQHWVGTWTASPYLDSANPPPVALSNSVLRQVTHVSLGGSQLRVQVSNVDGNGSLVVTSAHIALCKAAPAVDSSIDTTTDKALSFSGTASVTIAQGKELWSDPIDFTVPALANVTITMALGAVPGNITQHSGSRTTSYIQTGSTNVSAASLTSAQTTEHWFFISGIDVMAGASARGVVAIGDSITDGRGTNTNQNDRWTDILASRLHANAATPDVAVMNQGIGATNLVGTATTAAQARFDRDVLGQSGVRYAIVYDGVNDIGGGASFASMKAAYDDLISRAHARSLLIYGATITPFGGNSYYTAAHETVRQQVNTYIKSGVFDGVIDFDAALTDGGNPPKLQATYAAWSQMDGLHPGPAGYQKMGEAIDLTLFTK
ncbi:MAG TPA: SGNH/GDSL hydrolase family protein [Polyangia bacterium]|nr:SGNH/GDSL hydrolase family protein [Polyangia bacterium]